MSDQENYKKRYNHKDNSHNFVLVALSSKGSFLHRSRSVSLYALTSFI